MLDVGCGDATGVMKESSLATESTSLNARTPTQPQPPAGMHTS